MQECIVLAYGMTAVSMTETAVHAQADLLRLPHLLAWFSGSACVCAGATRFGMQPNHSLKVLAHLLQRSALHGIKLAHNSTATPGV